MNSTMAKRLAALEGKLSGIPITLCMPDDTQRIIDGRRPHYCLLWGHAVEVFQAEAAGEVPPASPRLDAELEWLKSCIKIVEPAGLWSLVKVLLEGPAECEEVGLHEV